MVPAVILGAASLSMFALAALQLFAAQTLDYRNPGRWLSLVANPMQFYGTVGATIIVGLALGILSATALQVKMSRELRKAGNLPARAMTKQPFRPEL
jgi:hypothetical protein